MKDEEAEQVADMLAVKSDRALPLEILPINEGGNMSYGIVFDVAGKDYIAMVCEVPKQRPRPLRN